MRSKLQMILWCAALVVGLWFLHSVGRGDLATPPAPQLWSRWSVDVGPAAAIVATLRVLALVAGWYLLVLTVVGSIGHRFRIRPIMAATETVSPRFLNRLVAGARGLTISELASREQVDRERLGLAYRVLRERMEKFLRGEDPGQ